MMLSRISCRCIYWQCYYQKIGNQNASKLLSWWIVFLVCLTRKRFLALYLPRTIARDLCHRESRTRREQDLNLRRTWFQDLLNETPRRQNTSEYFRLFGLGVLQLFYQWSFSPSMYFHRSFIRWIISLIFGCFF